MSEHTEGTEPLELLSPATLAKQLGLAKITLAKWRCAGGGPPFIRLGSRVLYPAADVRRWLEAQPRFSSTTEADAERLKSA